MTDKIIIDLPIRCVKNYDFHKFLSREPSCFELLDEVKTWLNIQGIFYEQFDYYHYRTSADLSAECQNNVNIFEKCRPKIVFLNKNDAILFKLVWA
jgi:hypothetical protein